MDNSKRLAPHMLAALVAAAMLLPACKARPSGAPAQVPAANVNGSGAIYALETKISVAELQPKLEAALTSHGFGILFRADIGKSLSGFAEKWGDDYNRSELDEIRAVMFCNPKQANAVANADPKALALCPLHITLIEKHGRATILFERPSQVAAQSPAIATLQKVEGMVMGAIDDAVGEAP